MHSEGKVRKSVAYNYACMLLLLLVQNSNDVRMLENHSTTLLSACKADDNNAKLLGTCTNTQVHAHLYLVHCSWVKGFTPVSVPL